MSSAYVKSTAAYVPRSVEHELPDRKVVRTNSTMGAPMSRGFLLVAVLSCGAAIASAQNIHEGIGVRVRAPSVLFARFEGVFLGRQGDTLIFGNDERGPIRVPASAITSLDVSAGKSRAQGALRGALWGGLTMAALALSMVNDPEVYDPQVDGSKFSYITDVGMGGAMLGAAVGVLVPRRIWKHSDARVFMTVTGSNRAAPNAIGVQFATAYSR